MKDYSLEAVYKTVEQCAKISRVSGGIGISFSSIRSAGSYISEVIFMFEMSTIFLK